MRACTEPVRTGIGAVCVGYGRPKWPITMLNHTHIVQKNVFLFLAPYARTTRYEEAFFTWKAKEKKARFARAPHDNGSLLWCPLSPELGFSFFVCFSLSVRGFLFRCCPHCLSEPHRARRVLCYYPPVRFSIAFSYIPNAPCLCRG